MKWINRDGSEGGVVPLAVRLDGMVVKIFMIFLMTWEKTGKYAPHHLRARNTVRVLIRMNERRRELSRK